MLFAHTRLTLFVHKWARYGINRSDQIGDAVKLMGVLGGSVLVGAPGALLGGYAANAWIKRTYKSRQQEGFLLDRGHFCGTEACEGCASEGTCVRLSQIPPPCVPIQD